MIPDFIASVDAGTGSIRAGVYSLKTQETTYCQEEWLYTPDPEGPPGSLIFDADDFFGKCKRVVLGALTGAKLPSRPAGAIAFTSQRDGVVFLDQNATEIYCGPNVDERLISEHWPVDEENAAYYRTSGRWICSLFLGYRLEWFKRYRPDEFSRIHKVLSMSDWLAFRFCGEYFAEPTNAGETGLFNHTKRRWNLDQINELEFPEDIFPKVVECGTEVGPVLRELAAELNISDRTQIIAGGADTQFATLGSGAYDSGELTVVAGTWGPMQLLTDGPVFDPAMRTWTGGGVIAGQWVLESTSMMLGLVHRWIRDTMYADFDDPYQKMEKEASAVSVEDEQIMSYIGVGLMDGKNLNLAPKGAMIIPSIYCLTRQMKRGHFARAVYLSTSFAVAYNYEQLKKLFPGIKKVFVCGGVVRSELWLHFVSHVLGQDIYVPEMVEATGTGGLIAAGVGIGLWDWKEGVETLVRHRTVAPNWDKCSQYEEMFKRWKAGYDAVVDVREKL